MYATVEKFKKYLEIEGNDQDETLELILKSASAEIDIYTGNSIKAMEEVPANIELICLQLSAITYNRIGNEHLKSETTGPIKADYLNEMPIYIQNTLKALRCVSFQWKKILLVFIPV